MRKDNLKIEYFRIRVGPMGSDESLGNNGVFIVPGPRGIKLQLIVSDGMGWEHVSVTPVNKNRCPYWDEMMFVKDLFWDEEEVVMQLHPKKSEYIDNHPFCLHLWRPIDQTIPTPPLALV